MDFRDRAAIEGAWYERFDEQSMNAVVVMLSDEGLEEEVAVPCHFEVCSTCDGRGRYVNPSIDAHGITAEEWDRDWSYEERQEYLSGGYDVTCATCGGRRVEPVPNKAGLTERQKAAVAYAEEGQRDRVEDAYIRRMENGGY